MKLMKKSALVAGVLVLLLGGNTIKASAAEESLVGLSGDYLRLYIDSSNSLNVIADEFVEDGETTLYNIDGKTQLLSQVAIADVKSYVNIRKGPSTDYDSIGRLYPGGLATAVSTENGWTKVLSGDIEGYIRSDFLLFGADAVKFSETYYSTHLRVTSSTLNLRSDASLNSSIKAQLFCNADLTWLETKGDWYKVKWQGSASSITGYVHKDYVTNDFKYALTLDEAKDYDEKNSYILSNIIWPLPSNHTIHVYFGYRVPPCPGASSYHRGLDIGGAKGLSIVAALSGTVTGAGYNESSGRYIVINHGNGVNTRYYHCSKLLVSEGESVSQGQVIGLVGSTGVSTGPHLHFAITINGNYVDPYPYIKGVQ